MEGLSFDLSLLLKTVDDILVTPTNFVRQTLKGYKILCFVFSDSPNLDSTVFPARLQPQDTQSLRNNHALLTVVWWGNTLEEFETFKSSSAAGAFMRSHSTDGTVKDLGGSTVMEGSGLFGVHNVTFVQKVVVTELRKQPSKQDYHSINMNRLCFGRSFQRC